MEKARFAAGCFWGVEKRFYELKGVVRTTVGYSGGKRPHPTYEQVCSGATGHAEAVEVEFDPSAVSYERLLEEFWNLHDPTQVNRQGPDIGTQYRSAIFYFTEEQKKLATRSKESLDERKVYSRPIATEIVAASEFYPAEEYHQKYFLR